MSAWKEACAAAAPSSVLIPAGSYMANPPIDMNGPCKAAIEIKATGATIKAPPELAKFKTDYWISIQGVDKLTMTGGVYDGQGQATWKSAKCHDSKATCQIPVNIRLTKVTNSFLNGVTSANSKYFHMNVLHCNNTKLDHVTISTPADSVNTDGIHIGRLTGLNITNSIIKAGDDCISFGDGSKNVHIEKVTCGPGHGISVGSLGKYPNEEPVQGIWVKNCTFTGTDNGVRIKSWPSSPPNTASDIHFEDIIMQKVGNPILIDQEYCPWNACKKGSPSKVKLTNVSFRKIKGTSSTKVAIRLICSSAFPCDTVELADINLTNAGAGGPATSECANIKPKIVGAVVPPACPAAKPKLI
ncbi:hypothetical protein L2E82_25488 [Cichorium intybus]|uniref:Uncharacterized protein n=1 Tax=Cichorium intybus TaxID=13427 RepID=A0ACB9E3T6_CICIN|nr:hypothetical protein L2E82_25488 [Cichorium intybus]